METLRRRRAPLQDAGACCWPGSIGQHLHTSVTNWPTPIFPAMAVWHQSIHGKYILRTSFSLSLSFSLVPSSLGLRNILVGKNLFAHYHKVYYNIPNRNRRYNKCVCGGWGITKEEMIHSDVSQSLTCQQDEDGQR